jgi:Nucleotidyltransferase of unknown function (DUF6036)
MEFLRRIDMELDEPAVVFVVGGSAVSMIDPTHATTDVDLMPPGSRAVERAIDRLKMRGEPVLPVQVAGTVEAPEGVEQRSIAWTVPGLTRLTVLAPERHDLAVMKLARGYPHDLQALESIHRIQPFDPNVLEQRFDETDVVGPRRRFALSFLDLIQRLFGDEEAKRREHVAAGLTW